MAVLPRNWNFNVSGYVRITLMTLAVVTFVAGTLLSVELFRQSMAEPTFRVRTLLNVAIPFFASVMIAGILLGLAALLGLIGTMVRQGFLLQTRTDELVAITTAVESRLKAEAAGSVPTSSGSPIAVSPLMTLPLAGQMQMDGRIDAPERPLPAIGDESPTLLLAADDEEQKAILLVMRQVRDLLMMNEAQRAQWAARHWESRKKSLQQTVERHLDAGRWQSAREVVQELQTLMPDDATLHQLMTRIELDREQRVAREIEHISGQLRHYMSLNAWDQAQEILDSVLQRYGEEARAKALAEEFKREKQAFERDNFERLLHDLKDATEHRLWRRAYFTAEEIVRRYPHEPRAEKLKADLVTLKENADAAERREEEQRFKDLLQRQRYEEALTLAHNLAARFPNTQTAAELTKLLPKVEDLIRQEKAKREQMSGKT